MGAGLRRAPNGLKFARTNNKLWVPDWGAPNGLKFTRSLSLANLRARTTREFEPFGTPLSSVPRVAA